jgi:hypothetical protein
MELLEKNPWMVYALCFLIAIGPAYHVWHNYPSIKADSAEGQEEQLVMISALGAIPFLGLMFAFFLEWYNKKHRISK